MGQLVIVYYQLLLAVVETALQLIFNIFEWPQKALKLWVKIAQNILVQIRLKSELFNIRDFGMPTRQHQKDWGCFIALQL